MSKTYQFETPVRSGLQPYVIFTGTHPSEIVIDFESMLKMTQLTRKQFQELQGAGDVPEAVPGRPEHFTLSEVSMWLEDHLDNTGKERAA